MSQAEAQALGLTSAVSTSYVGFSSALPFSYAVGSKPSSREYYFVGTVEHEITEDMGRVSLLNEQPRDYSPIDLFRYSAPGVRDLKTGSKRSTAYFSINNGDTDLGTWNNHTKNGDLGDWYGKHIPNGGDDAFNDYSDPGVVNAFSSSDLTLMQSLGWTTAGDPPGGIGQAKLVLLSNHIAASFVTAAGGHGGRPATEAPHTASLQLALSDPHP